MRALASENRVALGRLCRTEKSWRDVWSLRHKAMTDDLLVLYRAGRLLISQTLPQPMQPHTTCEGGGEGGEELEEELINL